MGFLSKIFGTNPEIEKENKFKKIEQQFKGGEINKAKAGWLSMRGNNSAMRRRFDMAISNFKEALEYEPNRPSTLISLGAVYNRKKAWKDGISILEKAKKFLPSIESDFLRGTQEHNLYHELGTAYFFTDDKKLAVENLTKSLEVVDKLKNLYNQGGVTEEEWITTQRMLALLVKNTEYLLARL